jgi:hypothetical protein
MYRLILKLEATKNNQICKTERIYLHQIEFRFCIMVVASEKHKKILAVFFPRFNYYPEEFHVLICLRGFRKLFHSKSAYNRYFFRIFMYTSSSCFQLLRISCSVLPSSIICRSLSVPASLSMKLFGRKNTFLSGNN